MTEVAVEKTPTAEDRLHHLEQRLEPLYTQLAAHPLYRKLRTLKDLHVFLESHVFAVWDFMSLLKALQRELTCVALPWTPSRLPESRRLVNEIVLGEESDLYEGSATSHFELYLRAMKQCGASTEAMEDVIFQLRQGEGIEDVLARVPVPAAARTFVRSTFAFIETGEPHVIAAAFTFGREDLIPDMFRAFLRDQDAQLSGRLSILRWYLDRHIEVDGDEHGPMALRMVSELCGADARKWSQVEDAAVAAIEARIKLWDGVADRVDDTVPNA